MAHAAASNYGQGMALLEILSKKYVRLSPACNTSDGTVVEAVPSS